MGQPAVLEDETWKDDAANMIAAYAASGLPFSSDDLRKSLREPPNPNMWGTAFRAACNRGIITSTGTRESTTPSRKGGLIRVWSAPTKGNHQ
jgi:hypothetical protein